MIEKDKRKKILLISDDLRTNSGVANVSKDLVINTCHHFKLVSNRWSYKPS